MSLKEMVADASKTQTATRTVSVPGADTIIAQRNSRRIAISIVSTATSGHWDVGKEATTTTSPAFLAGVPINYTIAEHGSLPMQEFHAIAAFGNVNVLVSEVIIGGSDQ